MLCLIILLTKLCIQLTQKETKRSMKHRFKGKESKSKRHEDNESVPGYKQLGIVLTWQHGFN